MFAAEASPKFVRSGTKKVTNSMKATMTGNEEEEDSATIRAKLLAKSQTMHQAVGLLNETVYKLEDGRQTKIEYQKFQITDISFGISTMIPIFVACMAYDLEFDEQRPVLLNTLLWVIFGVTNLSIFMDVIRHLQEVKYLRAINAIPRKSDIFSSGRIWHLLFDIFCLLLIPYPWTANIKLSSEDMDNNEGFYYHVNDIFCVIITVRFVFVLRTILHFTSYMSPRVVRLSYFYETENGYIYACKCLMKRFPLASLIVSYLSSIIIFAYMLRICERPLSRGMDADSTMLMGSYWNAIWCVIATMTTVGYGDFFAQTNFGRLISFFCCTWGAFIVSLMVVVLNNILEMDASEKKILVIMERLKLKKRLKIQAAEVITSMVRVLLSKVRPNAVVDEEQNKLLLKRMKMSLKSFREISRHLKTLHDDNVNEEMSRQFEFMRHEMREIKESVGEIYELKDSVGKLTQLLQRKVRNETFIAEIEDEPTGLSSEK